VEWERAVTSTEHIHSNLFQIYYSKEYVCIGPFGEVQDCIKLLTTTVSHKLSNILSGA
jgi:hypothetical protein